MATNSQIAAKMVDARLGPSGVRRIPSEVYDWAIAAVTKRLGEIDRLSNGVVQWGPDGETSFLSSDPLKPVLIVLNKYAGLGVPG